MLLNVGAELTYRMPMYLMHMDRKLVLLGDI